MKRYSSDDVPRGNVLWKSRSFREEYNEELCHMPVLIGLLSGMY